MPKCSPSYTGSPMEVGMGEQAVKAGGGNTPGEKIRRPVVGLIHCIPFSSPCGWCKPSLGQASGREVKVCSSSIHFSTCTPVTCHRYATHQTPVNHHSSGWLPLSPTGFEHPATAGLWTRQALTAPAAAHVPPLTLPLWLLGRGLSCPAQHLPY